MSAATRHTAGYRAQAACSGGLLRWLSSVNGERLVVNGRSRSLGTTGAVTS